MRATVILLCIFLSLTSCNNSEKNNDPDADPNQNINQNRNQNSGQNLDTNSQDNSSEPAENDPSIDSQSRTENQANSNKISNLSGTYINTEHTADNNCKCFCIEITEGTSELCLKENEIYIDARFVKKGENMEIYYSGKSSGSSDQEIPWDKFETGTPIAVISPEPGGNFKLDWKGFSIDGKIAIDYALYGKKTLEGTYKKK